MMDKKLKIAVHYEENMREDNFAFKWIEFLEKKGVNVLKINLRQSNVISEIRDCDGVMWHWSHTVNDKQCAPKILQAIEEGLKIPVFPNLESRWHYDEKVAQHYLLEAIKAPKIKSWVFWDYEEGEGFFEKANYPLVYKLSVGAGSSHVFKINSKKEAKKYLKINFKSGVFPYYRYFSEKSFSKRFLKRGIQFSRRFFSIWEYFLFGEYPKLPHYYKAEKNYIYVQEFLPQNDHDIRITVIGNRAFGFIRSNRPNDFRASGSGIMDYNPKQVPIEAVKIAHSISRKNGFQSMAYDFLVDKNKKIVVNEMSYCFGNTAPLIKLHGWGYWDRDLNWHKGSMWPQEAQVEDFLYYIKNKKLP